MMRNLHTVQAVTQVCDECDSQVSKPLREEPRKTPFCSQYRLIRGENVRLNFGGKITSSSKPLLSWSESLSSE